MLRDVNLEIKPGEFFGLLGPSGSGQDNDPAHSRGARDRKWRSRQHGRYRHHTCRAGARDVAMVFQSYAPLSHMTVAHNIGFPLRWWARRRLKSSSRLEEAAKRVNIGISWSASLDSSRAASSSGVHSPARSCASRSCSSRRTIVQPGCHIRLETRLELHDLQRTLATTTVYVTHDQEEAMTLADRIAVFMEGRIAQVGTPREVYGARRRRQARGVRGTPQMNLLPPAGPAMR